MIRMLSIISVQFVLIFALSACKRTQTASVQSEIAGPIILPSENPIVLTQVGQAAINNAADIIKTSTDVMLYNQDHKFKPVDVIIDADGSEHVRFHRTYKDAPVLGGDLVTHRLKNDPSKRISVASSNIIDVDVTELVSKERATQIASAAFQGKYVGTRSARKVIFNAKQEPRVAWEIIQSGVSARGLMIEKKIFVDARRAIVLAQWDQLQSVAAQGQGFHSGTVNLNVTASGSQFLLKDSTRGNTLTGDLLQTERADVPPPVSSPTTLFGDGNLNPMSLAVDAQFGAALTWDYFLNIHGRKGTSNDGRGVKSRINYGVNYGNAFYDPLCDCVTYGSGDGQFLNATTGLDVVAHEICHGLTTHTADLLYWSESGGLNEATSDIFGAMVEFHANIPSDPPDYILGEKVVVRETLGEGLRFLYNPNLDGFSPNCYTDAVADMEVHSSSGIGNHFFYLLAEGSNPASPLPPSPTCNNSQLKGIGRQKAARIWYRALITYMTSTTDYRGARLATIRAANDLFGKASPESTSVAAAWAAVGLTSNYKIEAIPDQMIQTGKRHSIVIVIQNAKENCATELKVMSSNKELIPQSGLVASRFAPSCLLTIQPVANKRGQSTITLSYGQGETAVSQNFQVTVADINVPPQITNIPDQSIKEDTTLNVNMKVSDKNDPLNCAKNLDATWDNSALLDPRGLSFRGTAPHCTLVLRPYPNANGKTKVTVTVKDPSDAAATDSFNLTVVPVNDAPNIQSIKDQRLLSSTTLIVSLKVVDVDNQIQCAAVKATSSNQSIVKNSSLTISGTAPNCLLKIVPLKNGNGATVIKLGVTDGKLKGTRSFKVNVTR